MTDAQRAKVNDALSLALKTWSTSKSDDLVSLVRRLNWVAAWTVYGPPKSKDTAQERE